MPPRDQHSSSKPDDAAVQTQFSVDSALVAVVDVSAVISAASPTAFLADSVTTVSIISAASESTSFDDEQAIPSANNLMTC